jgi:pSer/pThr/pTyr-binding forkhead associated (FHA) protein
MLIRVCVPDRSIFLFDSEIVIGRSPYCVLLVSDPSVSRVHAALRRKGGRIELSDLGSSNGTFVNGRRILKSEFVTAQDEIRVGDVPVRLEEVQPTAVGSTKAIEAGEASVDSAENRRIAEALRHLR